MYVLRKTDFPKEYVAKKGLHDKYTLVLNRARVFKTREEAEKIKQGSEQPVYIPGLMPS